MDIASFGSLNLKDAKYQLGVLPNYTTAIEAYTRRRLGRPNDNLRAIREILSSLDLRPYHAGLPRSVLSLALLWQPSLGPARVRPETPLPTWSWAAWELDDGCSWNLDGLEMTRDGINDQTCENMICDPRYSKISEELRTVWDVEDAGAAICVVSQNEATSIFRSNRSNKCHSPNQAPARSKLTASRPPSDDNHAALLLHTHVVKLHLERSYQPLPPNGPRQPESGFHYHHITDTAGDCVGIVLVSDDTFDPTKSHDFVTLTFARGDALISWYHGVIPDKYRPGSLPMRTQWDRLDSEGLERQRQVMQREDWPAVNVMLISRPEERGVRIARRVALGTVMFTAWLLAERREEELMLV